MRPHLQPTPSPHETPMQNLLHKLAFLVLACIAWCGLSGAALAQRPAITGFSPASGTVGSTVTIDGTNFNRDVNGALWTGAIPWRVRFSIGGGVATVTPTFVSATRVTAVVPAGAQSAPISLSQGFTVMSTSTATYTVISAPAASSFTPTSGAVGTEITISGSSFNRDANGALWSGQIPWRVRFLTATGTTDVIPLYVSASTIRVNVPAGARTGTLRLVQGATVMSTTAGIFTVNNTGTLRLTNSARYDIISLTINGTQQFSGTNGLPIGSTLQTNLAPGNYTVVAGLGFFTATGARDVWFTDTRTVTISTGVTNGQTVQPLSLSALLTAGSATRRWNGIYLTSAGVPRVATYIFNTSNGWTMQDQGVNVSGGSTKLLSWPNRSTTVSFQTIAGGPVAVLDIRTAKITQAVGPASWPTIEFLRE